MRSKKNDKSKSLSLAVYFGGLVLIIIVISLCFKVFETIKHSKFDGSHHFTVAVFNNKTLNIVSVSPQDHKISKLVIGNVGDFSDVEGTGLSIDAKIKTNDPVNSGPKTFFLSLIKNYRSLNGNITILDLIRLESFAFSVGSDNISDEKIDNLNSSSIETQIKNISLDKAVVDENKNVQVINTTSTGGLGNRIAKIVTNLGANVVLVGSSRESDKSVILYQSESYTAKELSKIFNIPLKKNDQSSISDITIILGKDFNK